FTDVSTSGATSYPVSIKYVDETAVKYSTLDNADIRITGPGGFNVLATFDSGSPASNAPTINASYHFTPPGGSWDFADDGIYTVTMESNAVTDNVGNFVPGGTLGTFKVVIPQTLVVMNTNDSGAGSLRQALTDANAVVSNDIINFDPTVFASAQTIT